MPVREDPENNEIKALTSLANLDEALVLEVGSGDGRLTWKYAHAAAKVVAVDPFQDSVERAWENLPDHLRGRVEFHHADFREFASRQPPAQFDLALLSWSL